MARRRVRREKARAPEKARDLPEHYLEVMKLALLDLNGTSTGRVSQQDGRTVTEVPVDDDIDRRWGNDWPLSALTMIGRERLDHLQKVVAHVVTNNVEGDLLEAGVWRGGASMFMKAALVAYGDEQRRVVLADSFSGVPRPKQPGGDFADGLYQHSHYLGVPRADVERHFARYGLLDDRVEFVKGLFDKSMPRLGGRQWSVLRLDGDLYESVMPPLEHLYEGLSPGGFVIIDDYAIPQAARAVADFRARANVTEPLHGIDWCAKYWQKA